MGRGGGCRRHGGTAFKAAEEKAMSALVIPELDDSILARLREPATSHGRTAEAEAREILAVALQAPPDPWADINAFRERLRASGRTFSDSTELLREDRKR
jgi:plasmid stability protein